MLVGKFTSFQQGYEVCPWNLVGTVSGFSQGPVVSPGSNLITQLTNLFISKTPVTKPEKKTCIYSDV